MQIGSTYQGSSNLFQRSNLLPSSSVTSGTTAIDIAHTQQTTSYHGRVAYSYPLGQGKGPSEASAFQARSLDPLVMMVTFLSPSS